MGLGYLRGNVTVIPQDPSVFQGTLKYNVDPFGERTDQEIVDALVKSQVWDTFTVETLAKKDALDTKPESDAEAPTPEESDDSKLQNLRLNLAIEAGGHNLSVGQKQLICVARAFVRKPKILLMDEATANIDEKTDQAVQALIKTEFLDTTVITIAHRYLFYFF